MSPIEDSLTDSRVFRAWAGTAADLLPVLEAMQRQYRELREPFIESQMRHRLEMQSFAERSVASAEALLAEVGSDSPMAQREYADRVDRAQAELRQAEEKTSAARYQAEHGDDIDLQITTRSGAERNASGTPEEIVDYLTHKQVRSMRVSTPAGPIAGHRMTIFFDRGETVRFNVSSTDSRWAQSALAEVGEALEHRVPSWAWLRSWAFLAVFFYVVAFTAAFFVFDFPTTVSASTNNTSVGNGLLLGVFIGAAALTATWLARRYIPAFEILPIGGKARVDRIVVALGAGLVTIALGVLVNRIS